LGHWFKQIFGSSQPDQPREASLPQAESDSQMAEQFDSIDAASHLLPYDENLLERARTQWQFGDWQSLANLDRDTLQHHPDRAKLVLLAAAGRLQIGQYAEARQYTRLAQDWGVSKKLLTQILAAGVHNSLGRAAAMAGEQTRALQHFEAAIQTGTPGSDNRLLTQARINEQFSQLGLLDSPIFALSTVQPVPPLLRDEG
jgi:tetratricopeptide (TPR) repeat protein